jgi:hypothetical protein
MVGLTGDPEGGNTMKSKSALACSAALIALAGTVPAQPNNSVEGVVVTGSRVISGIFDKS